MTRTKSPTTDSYGLFYQTKSPTVYYDLSGLQYIYSSYYTLSTTAVIIIFILLILFIVFMINVGYKRPIQNNPALSIFWMFFCPFVYVIYRSIERPLACTGYSPVTSMIFGFFLFPIYLIFVICGPEDEPAPFLRQQYPPVVYGFNNGYTVTPLTYTNDNKNKITPII